MSLEKFIEKMESIHPEWKFRIVGGYPEDNRRGYWNPSPEFNIHPIDVFIRRLESDEEVEIMKKKYEYENSLRLGGEGEHGFVSISHVKIPTVQTEYRRTFPDGTSKIIIIEVPAWK